ncbi:MAG TPA: hypothetical protein VJC20_01940 [Candidatus Paceibacterota bacterium]
MEEKEVGKVIHWYDKIGVAVVKLSDTLTTGDKIKVKRGENEAEDSVLSMQVDHKDVPSAKAGDEVAVKISGKAKEGACVCRVG